MLRALPAALRMLADRREAHASAGRCGGPGSAQPVGDPGHTPGAGIQPLVGPNGEEGAAITVPVNGFTFKMTFVKCGNGTYYVLGCPKSNGDANTSSRGSLDVTQRIMEGGTLIRQESTSWKYDDRLRGKVMEDAHLRHFDFKRKEVRLRVATGGFVQQGTATRTIRVNMPSGQYDVQHSSTTITGDADAFNADDLAASIRMAIEEYKEAENGGSFLHTDGWATENRQRDPYCAKAVFDPVSEAVRLSKGQAKTVSVYAQGNDGGRAAGARWTILDPSNAVFTPSSPSGANPTLNYTVSNSPSGDHVRVTLKFTSTAGVGKDTWTQPIGVLYRGTVSGTRGVHGTGCNPTWEFTYSASLRESGVRRDAQRDVRPAGLRRPPRMHNRAHPLGRLRRPLDLRHRRPDRRGDGRGADLDGLRVPLGGPRDGRVRPQPDRRRDDQRPSDVQLRRGVRQRHPDAQPRQLSGQALRVCRRGPGVTEASSSPSGPRSSPL